MKDLNEHQLKKLYSDFVRYRDVECNGFSDVSIEEFYRRDSDKYQNVTLNQCDGCNRELPIVNGLHRSVSGHPVMACKAGLFA